MSFDPEKVERRYVEEINGDYMAAGVYVQATDYDELLALYRELRDRPYSTWPEGG